MRILWVHKEELVSSYLGVSKKTKKLIKSRKPEKKITEKTEP
jgi:hypothetical protein